MHRTAVRNGNREVIDPFAGITDPVEIIMIFHEKRSPRFTYKPYRKPLNEVYQSLKGDEIPRLFDTMRELLNSDAIETFSEIAVELISFCGVAIAPLHKELVTLNEYYPPLIFWGADDRICLDLIEKLSEPEQNRNHILSALAWIGSPCVVALFANWQKSPPAWADELFIQPHEYASEAGWILNGSGEKVLLVSENAYALTASEEEGELVATFKKSAENCPWCGTPLITLFELEKDLLGFGEGSFEIKTCYHCTAYAEALYMELDSEGEAVWSEYNEKPEFLPNDAGDLEVPQENCLYRKREKRPVLFAANQFLPVSFSQIGGYPTWQQDAAYPLCPKCQKRMMFVGQIDSADVEEYGEGLYYGFACLKCGVTATGYQQT